MICRLKHMSRNMKRESLLEDRWKEIERSNKLLVRRMREIMSGAEGNYSQHPLPQDAFRPVSLNYRVRRAREDQIQTENRAIIRRLCASKSNYTPDKTEPRQFQRQRCILPFFCFERGSRRCRALDVLRVF